MTEPLSIAVVCFPSLGGSGVIASELSVGLAQRGHRVRVLASAPLSRPLPASERLSFHEVATPSYPLFDQAPYALALTSALIDLAREHRIDVIHVHYAVPHAASALLAREALGPRGSHASHASHASHVPRVVTTLHGTDVTHVGSDASYRAVTRYSVEASDAVTVPSAHLKQDAYELLGVDPCVPIEVIPNFVDTQHFAPAAQRDRTRLSALLANAGVDTSECLGPVLFHASNFRAVKRVSDLLEVLARVRRHVPARLLLVGDGPEVVVAAQRARELGVQQHVCFLGRRVEFVEYLQHSDVFVLPSETESFGLAALEAMSTGMPVCAYRVGGLHEVVTPDVGRLVEPFDVAQLAQAVLEVVTDDDKRHAMGRAARARALASFQQEPALERYEAVYWRALAGRAPAQRGEHA